MGSPRNENNEVVKKPMMGFKSSKVHVGDAAGIMEHPSKSKKIVPVIDGKAFGTMLSEPTIVTTPPIPNNVEESYVPVALARSHLEKVVNDMRLMKAEHTNLVEKLKGHFKDREETTKVHYENFIADLKSRSLERIQYHKDEYLKMVSLSTEERVAATATIEKLEHEILQSNVLHSEQKSRWDDDQQRLDDQRGLVMREVVQMHANEVHTVKHGHFVEKNAYESLIMTLRNERITLDEKITMLNRKLNHFEKPKHNDQVEVVLQEMLQHLEYDAQQEADNHAHFIKEKLDIALKKLEIANQKIDNFKQQAMVPSQSISLPQSSSLPGVELHEDAQSNIGDEEDEEDYQNIDTTELDVQHRELIEEAREIYHNKAHVKSKIKEWLHNFEAKNGRQPSLEDKKAIRPLYISYKKAAHAYSKKNTEINTYQNPSSSAAVNAQADTTSSASKLDKDQSSEKLSDYAHEIQHLQDQVRNLTNQLEHASSAPQSVVNTVDIVQPVQTVPQTASLPETQAKETSAEHERALELQKQNLEQIQQELKSAISDKLALEAEVDALRMAFQQENNSHESTNTAQDEEAKSECNDETQEIAVVKLDPATNVPAIIVQGKEKWTSGDRKSCFEIYEAECERILIAHDDMDLEFVRTVLEDAKHIPNYRGALKLREALNNFLTAFQKQDAPHDQETEEELSKVPSNAILKRRNARIDAKAESKAAHAAPTPSKENTKMIQEYKQKLKVLENKAKADKVKITQLESQLSKLKSTASDTSGKGKDDEVAKRMLERKLADAEKKAAAALDELDKQSKKKISLLESEIRTSKASVEAQTATIKELQSNIKSLEASTSGMEALKQQALDLETKAAEAESTKKALEVADKAVADLQKSYLQEQSLRKKYYNQIEDMKELERGNVSVVKYVDEYTMELETSKGVKSFSYDQVFSPANTQEQVFEDTKNLMQSAMDGYNVCIFAYGQTGSGKTFTMSGVPSAKGITPRAIQHIFDLKEEAKGNNTIKLSAYMMEIYNDSFIDLFYLLEHANSSKAPKLDVKKNSQGMVVVSNIVIKDCNSPDIALQLFDEGNKKRRVGATKMNAESSRSHSVFSLLVENYDHTTKKTSVGKLSLVDLAGSERVGKTGAAAERLKEAQAINKSLSALGDVISALSTNEKFIPYRNNKLTQLMQDSLGGNAKTLMFVNISPADYNADETQTSLQYASRVKLITNTANKNAESEVVAKLKATLKKIKHSGTDGIDWDDVI